MSPDNGSISVGYRYPPWRGERVGDYQAAVPTTLNTDSGSPSLYTTRSAGADDVPMMTSFRLVPNCVWLMLAPATFTSVGSTSSNDTALSTTCPTLPPGIFAMKGTCVSMSDALPGNFSTRCESPAKSPAIQTVCKLDAPHTRHRLNDPSPWSLLVNTAVVSLRPAASRASRTPPRYVSTAVTMVRYTCDNSNPHT